MTESSPDRSANGSLPPVRFALVQKGTRVERRVTRRDGQTVRSSLLVDGFGGGEDWSAAAIHDAAWLRKTIRPKWTPRHGLIRSADLFSGCGAMTLGLEEACRALGLGLEPALAVDLDPAACEVYEINFPSADVRREPIQSILDNPLGARLSASERGLRKRLATVEIAIGGPPCQGHSDLNNHTRRRDEKNSLFAVMARFAEVVQPRHLIIENVNGVKHDQDRVLQRTVARLDSLGYSVHVGTLDSSHFGVAQARRRVFVVATAGDFDGLNSLRYHQTDSARPFDWACGDLVDAAPSDLFHRPTKASRVTSRRIDVLFDKNLYDLPDEHRPDCHRLKAHSYRSVYGRLRMEEPAPTITTGFQVMGQGRFVHPIRRRTLTPHEGARLQFFPDWFDFGSGRTRTEFGRLIGNAVPSKLLTDIAIDLLR